MSRLDRRRFLSMAAGSLAGFSALQTLVAPSARGAVPGRSLRAPLGAGGYGPLVPAGPELALPEGFEYKVFGRQGSTMSDGYPTPRAHDGMAAFPLPNGNIRLIRNHEADDRAIRAVPFGDPATAYDQKGCGGTTSLEVHTVTREIVRDFVSLNGTAVNCAGGPTPWGSWLTCEETTYGPRTGREKPHGYIFEVPVAAESAVSAVPIKAMGRFKHEAIAVDPATGIVYETEDQSRSGFFRFIPANAWRRGSPADLSSGRLQMLAVVGKPGYVTNVGQKAGVSLTVNWVDIPDPDPATVDTNEHAVFDQGLAAGGAVFDRLEGCWYADGRIYIDATEGGDTRLGQIWEYRPDGAGGGELKLLFESPDPSVLQGPDNICVSPRGGLVICEDRSSDVHIRGLTRDGLIFDFARNTLNNREFAGATFSPDGRTLFVNIQGDTGSRGSGYQGMTIAIWGPWEKGSL